MHGLSANIKYISEVHLEDVNKQKQTGEKVKCSVLCRRSTRLCIHIHTLIT